MLHLIGFAMLLMMVWGAVTRAPDLGRVARWLLYAVGVALILMIIGVAVDVIAPMADVAAIPAGVGLFGLFLLSLPLGVALWRSPTASRLTAAILIAILPLLLIIGFGGDITGVTLPIFVVESPLMLGFASFGYDLVRARPGQPA